MSTETESKEMVVLRLRIDSEFKAEVEQVARDRQISASALTRLALADYIAAWKRRSQVAAAEPDGR